MAAVDHIARSAATDVLYRRHAQRVLRYCLGCLRRPADAEDALQQTFLQAHRALGCGQQPVSEVAWLLAIARNVCLTRADAQRRRSRTETPEDPAVLAEIAATADADEGLSAEVQAAFGRLSNRQRQALFLREWHGSSYAEIAAALGTTESAVETLIFRARRALRDELRSRRRRAPLAAALPWLRGWFGSMTAKVAVGAAAAFVSTGAGLTLGTHHGTPSRAPAVTPAAAVAQPAVRATRARPALPQPHATPPAGPEHGRRRHRRSAPAPPDTGGTGRPAAVPVVTASAAPALPVARPTAATRHDTVQASPPTPSAPATASPSSPRPANAGASRPVDTPPVDESADKTSDAADGATETVAGAVPPATAAVSQTVDAVTQAVAGAVPPVTGALSQTVDQATQTVAKTVDSVTQAVARAAPPVTDAASQTVDVATGTVAKTVDAAPQAVADAVPAAPGAAAQSVDGTVQAASTTVDQAAAAAGSATTTAVSTVTNLLRGH